MPVGAVVHTVWAGNRYEKNMTESDEPIQINILWTLLPAVGYKAFPVTYKTVAISTINV